MGLLIWRRGGVSWPVCFFTTGTLGPREEARPKSFGSRIDSKMSNPYIGLWAECRDGTIGEIVEMDKAGYCTLKDIHGVIVKKHEPINKLKT
jgi:hypothetical protein